MEDLGTELMSELQSKISFVIPLFGGIPVPTSVVVTWGIMAFLMILTLIFVRNLKLIPKGPQLYVEALVGFINNFFDDILGEEGKRYIPYLGTVLIYITCANLIGIFGITPPTKDLNITAGLAVMSIILIEYSGIHAKGPKGWLKSFREPMSILTPINLLEVFIRPLSLCMRLFGNVLGSFVIMELIKIIVPVVIPIPFSFYFDIFDGVIQAYVFVFLTSLFMKEKMEE
ncbi:F0F1 ATP synthase subunit A [Anaerocolumna sp. MB42-C2]|uniref:F0F1 ATP synthase subunit A n=1 Tax=Anaerocolumna sp. MB42-C2 TaxID=3070997 RepID=UPI0027E02275|nr:F0F1 ATP synthase subunit A [Anaerocolumna sp. MB42-C2]WMJ87274.1 F0F1 ATP synthase subunit A [Anaerocolumna sp. MB42-C2]